MTPGLLTAAVIILMLLLIGLRVPIAIALIVAGFAGYAGLEGFGRASSMLLSLPEELLRGYSLSVVPLFVMMGAVAARADLSASLYDAARALSTKRARGGLASATIGSCAMFGSICGSSIATAATMTPIAYPEMRQAGYSNRLAAGSIAAGGTIGILIPPSVVLIVYALLVEESVPALFAGAFVPGVVLTVLCILVVKAMVTIRPELAGPAQSFGSFGKRLLAVAATWKIALIFGVSLGGIYLGWFSPTEAAAVGAGLALLVAAASGKLSWRSFVSAMDETVATSAMLFLIFIGALMFARFIALAKFPELLATTIGEWNVASPLVIAALVLIYLVLGCFLDTIAMILITAPVFLPLVQSVGYDAVWFGIFITVVAEMGLITPPVGMNIFVIRAQLPEVPLLDIIRGSLPFLAAHLALVALISLFPGLVSWLPGVLT